MDETSNDEICFIRREYCINYMGNKFINRPTERLNLGLLTSQVIKRNHSGPGMALTLSIGKCANLNFPPVGGYYSSIWSGRVSTQTDRVSLPCARC